MNATTPSGCARFPHFQVEPSSDLKGIDHSPHLDTLQLRAPPGLRPKWVYCPGFITEIGATNFPEHLARLALEPCEHGPFFLIGLARQLSQNPDAYWEGDIVAATCKVDDRFADETQHDAFLFIEKTPNGPKLELTRADGLWKPRWRFLAQEVPGGQLRLV